MNVRSTTIDHVSESVWSVRKRKQRYQEHVYLVARVPNPLLIYQQDTFTLLCLHPRLRIRLSIYIIIIADRGMKKQTPLISQYYFSIVLHSTPFLSDI